ncbi:capsular biosynthesis protein [Pseudoalteromonas agarivorans]|uniref:Capsular biosynthesis protein n=1 Tax=Pseudoalteromonas agarivorans TaxID=176102 RepID=A0AAD0XDG8_9GAMM|nr:HAD hydrolase family protein [Pseudoalteromonas agarivorans]AYM88152.1 capsular biosynthesis protein [Pseudoalteromonas agarivorans]
MRKKLVVDLDGTLTLANTGNYSEVLPNLTLIKTLQQYSKSGFDIVIATARNMRTYEGNVGKINIHTLPTIVEWLEKHEVPYDEIIVGKPWCGFDGFYIDDKSIRPSEFASMSYDEIMQLLAKENAHTDSGNEL